MKNMLLVVGLLMIGSSALAQRGDNNRPRGDRFYQQDRQEMIAERLELTDEQQAELEDLRMAHLKSTSTIKSELKIKNAELDAAISADQIDQKKVDNLVEAINSLQGNLFTENVNHRMEVRAMLDDKQRLVFDQMRHMFDRHRGKRG